MQANVREPVEEQVGYLVKRVQQAVRAALDAALAAHGVGMAQYAALAALEREPGLSNAELARRSFVTAQSMHTILAALQERGLVERVPHPAHGRVLQARLSAEGEALVGRCHEAAAGVHERMLAGMDEAGRERLRDALRRCAEALEGAG